MSQVREVKVRFFPPPEDMCRFFTTFYLVEIATAADLQVSDYLHPEWANLRFHTGELCAETCDGVVVTSAAFAATGPSSRAVRFSVGPIRIWGIGLLPLGWAKYIGAPAVTLANVVTDGFVHPAFAGFGSLARTLFGPEPDCEAELARIVDHFTALGGCKIDDEARIVAVHDALIDPDVHSVTGLVERSGCSQRTMERVCQRAFGFSPKLLLRRQRFMRSLAQFMLDPSLRWIGAIDSHYHDQAQFVRDFREFMGMTPRQYAALDKPILKAIMHERARFAGTPVQTLDRPSGAGSGRRPPIA